MLGGTAGRLFACYLESSLEVVNLECLSMNLPVSLEESIRTFMRAARAVATRKAYAADMRVFEGWCAERGYIVVPLRPSIVAAFLADQTQTVSLATIQRRACAIAYFARAGKLENPINDEVHEVLAGIRRAMGAAPLKAKAALTVHQIRAMIDVMGFEAIDVRDRALILLGFAGAMRRSELAALDIEHIEHVPAGLLVRIVRSKTDQEGQGQVIAIMPANDSRYCPIAAVDALIRTRLSGPLFYGQANGRICTATIAAVVKRRAAAAGIDASTVGAHSLRSGFVTSASLSGANLFKIMEVSRHKNVDSVRRYFKGELFDQHAASKLL
jgi:integrase